MHRTRAVLAFAFAFVLVLLLFAFRAEGQGDGGTVGKAPPKPPSVNNPINWKIPHS